MRHLIIAAIAVTLLAACDDESRFDLNQTAGNGSASGPGGDGPPYQYEEPIGAPQ
jgi:hypothetical protein